MVGYSSMLESLHQLPSTSGTVWGVDPRWQSIGINGHVNASGL